MAVALAPQHGVLRAVRGTALATVNGVLAAAAHAAGGGGVPDGALTMVLTAGIAAVGTALADRRRGPFAVLGAVAVTQVVLHLLLDALGGHHTPAPPAPTGPALLLAHAAAVVVTASLLAGADSALFAVARALGRDLLGRIAGTLPTLLPASPPPTGQPAPLRPAGALPVALQQMLCRVTPHRGPPRAA